MLWFLPGFIGLVFACVVAKRLGYRSGESFGKKENFYMVLACVPAAALWYLPVLRFFEPELDDANLSPAANIAAHCLFFVAVLAVVLIVATFFSVIGEQQRNSARS